MWYKLYKLYFALRHNKLLHLERFYALTYDNRSKMFCVWSIDGSRRMTLFSSCKDWDTLEFTWNVLMDRGDLVCPL